MGGSIHTFHAILVNVSSLTTSFGRRQRETQSINADLDASERCGDEPAISRSPSSLFLSLFRLTRLTPISMKENVHC